jgi:exopolysaccharide production protein ExoZ
VGPRNTETLLSVQYLRAAAAIGVIVYHQVNGRADGALDFTYHAVDLFFVISGFIMVAMTDAVGQSPGRFLRNRIARVAPLYWVATALTFACVVVGLPMPGGNPDPILLLRSLLFIPTVNELDPALAADKAFWPTMFLGWTLNYEMFFYAVFALLLPLPGRWRVWALAAALIVPVVLGALFPPERHTLAHFYSRPWLVDFLAGALMGRVFGLDLRRNSTRDQILATTAIVAFMLACATAIPRLVPCAICTGILGLALLTEKAGWVPWSRAGRFLGDASYSIYLVQEFAFLAVTLTVAHWPIPAGLFGDAAMAGARTLAAIGLGALAHVAIEKPITRFARRLLARLGERSAAKAPSVGRGWFGVERRGDIV